MRHFAFNSIKEALMIFSAIPLSAVSGVLFLWMRGLPFSISAGVGFIALFGIAVLNGIVLIEHLKSLKEQGFDDVNERILKGTKERLRPVILTAAAAALGFLPMAVSTNAGAEVQRPLATVVIGGLITATVLTMVVLPVLYSIFDTKKFKMKRSKITTTVVIVLFMLVQFYGFSQEKTIALEELISIAVQNNKELAIKNLEVDKSGKLIGTAFEIEKTKLYYTNDETNLGNDGKPFETNGIDQTIEFPTIYFARKKAQKITASLAELTYEIAKDNLIKEVSKSYYSIVYLNKRLYHLQQMDSLYFNFSHAAKRKFELGESNYLEMITAQSKYKQYATQLSQAYNDISIAYTLLNGLLQNEETYKISETELRKIKILKPDLEQHLLTEYNLQNTELFKAKRGIVTQELLPDLQFNYFNSKDVKANNSVNSFQAGVGIPLFFFEKSAKIASSKIAQDIADEQASDLKFKLHSKYKMLLDELKKSESQLAYFNESGNKVADEILKTATSSYKNGEIDFFQYIQGIETSNQITIDYLSNLNLYNQIALEINYLIL